MDGSPGLVIAPRMCVDACMRACVHSIPSHAERNPTTTRQGHEPGAAAGGRAARELTRGAVKSKASSSCCCVACWPAAASSLGFGGGSPGARFAGCAAAWFCGPSCRAQTSPGLHAPAKTCPLSPLVEAAPFAGAAAGDGAAAGRLLWGGAALSGVGEPALQDPCWELGALPLLDAFFFFPVSLLR